MIISLSIIKGLKLCYCKTYGCNQDYDQCCNSLLQENSLKHNIHLAFSINKANINFLKLTFLTFNLLIYFCKF